MPVLQYVEGVLVATAGQLALLLGPLVLFGFLMHAVAGQVERGTIRLIGNRPYLFLFGWLGVIVHEGSHAILCIVFGHRIIAIKWFDLSAQDGNLGEVSHSWNTRSMYQSAGNFFIGIAPLLGGALVLMLAATYLIDPHLTSLMQPVVLDEHSVGSLGALVQQGASIWHGTVAVFDSLLSHAGSSSWRFALFLYVAFAIGSAVTLSPADFRGAAMGLGILIALVLVLNMLTFWTGGFLTDAARAGARAAGVGYAVMLFALALNVIAAALVIGLRIGVGAAGTLRGRG